MGVTDARRAGPGTAIWLVLAIAVAVVAIYWDTASSIAAIWHRSNTFGHGYLIPPITAWLVWRRRDQLAATALRPSPAWIALLAALGFAWLWGRLSNTLILEQYAFALLIPTAIGAVLGSRVVRVILFPLGFLLLAVPAGDFIVPPLVEFTAAFAVKALTITGVPVARSGPFLTLPNGEWAVSDACSGFRYLAASLTLGCLYAYLRFRTWRFRLFFIGLSILIPIIANGFRAYLIVLLGYLSDMKLAVGVDHYIYGWTLFAVFCALLFWIGSLLREPAPGEGSEPAQAPAPSPHPVRAVALTGLVAAAVIGIWPLYEAGVEGSVAKGGPPALSLPASAGEWQRAEDPITLWHPDYSGAALQVTQAYRRDDRIVALHVAYYRRQQPGAELINSMNSIVSLANKEWRQGHEGPRTVTIGGRPAELWETVATRPTGRLLIWHRYWLRGDYTASPYVAQLLELRGRMLTGRDDAALVVLFAPFDDRPGPAAEDLDAFANAVAPALDAALRRAAALP